MYRRSSFPLKRSGIPHRPRGACLWPLHTAGLVLLLLLGNKDNKKDNNIWIETLTLAFTIDTHYCPKYIFYGLRYFPISLRGNIIYCLFYSYTRYTDFILYIQQNLILPSGFSCKILLLAMAH